MGELGINMPLNKLTITDEDSLDIQHLLHFLDMNSPVSGHSLSNKKIQQLRIKLIEVTGVSLEEQHPELFTAEYKLKYPQLFSDIDHNCLENLWYNDYEWIDDENLVATAECEICGEEFKETMDRVSIEKVNN